MKECPICTSTTPLKKSPLGHERRHGNDERACGECWEAWLSMQVEECQPQDIKCLFCDSVIDKKQLAELAWKGTVERAAMKIDEKPKDGVVCMTRCNQVVQDFDREKDGRVFTCTFCAFQVCVDCDSPEHEGETCSHYRSRMASIHGVAEAESQAVKNAFCPDCNIPILKPGGCSYTQCGRCFYRFCSGCMIPWVGVGSAYLGGRAAHSPGCVYHSRDDPSAHSLKHRYQEDEDGQARKVARRAAGRAKRSAKKRAMAEHSDGGSQPRQKGKKRDGDQAEMEKPGTAKRSKKPNTEDGFEEAKTEPIKAEPKVKEEIEPESGAEKTRVKVEVKPEIKTET